ncbi:hypothetical protein Taro_006757 [Colocasia esculenta]|uniref:Uncharacterized protein n=1 Tax=Colocasia esculenta TaxID=4460 RepID=A0A843TTB5_COLES|nr:hypothetical protein [Colocasia esculenta]
MRLWSHLAAPVFRELLCLGWCVPSCCFSIVLDSAGSVGVVFGLTRVVVEIRGWRRDLQGSLVRVREVGCGAKSKAAEKGVVIKELPVDRRSKFRHDPYKRKSDFGHSGTPSKWGRSTPQSNGKSPMTSIYPKRKVLHDSSDSYEDGSSFNGTPSTNPKRQLIEESSSDTSGSVVATSSKTVIEGRSILKPRVVDLSDQELVDAFLEFIPFFEFQGWLHFISVFRTFYPRLVQEFYSNIEDTEEGVGVQPDFDFSGVVVLPDFDFYGVGVLPDFDFSGVEVLPDIEFYGVEVLLDFDFSVVRVLPEVEIYRGFELGSVELKNEHRNEEKDDRGVEETSNR